MTLQVNGGNIIEAIHVVRIVGTIVMILVVCMVTWWAVRPSRRTRDRRDAIETEPADNEELWRVMDRMEERLEVLERAMADQIEPPRARRPRQDEIHAPADEDRVSGRTK